MSALTAELCRLPAQLRETVRPLLPERAFLRRDRGDALFVTNAPCFADAPALQNSLEAVGFVCAKRGGVLRISPGSALLTSLEVRWPPPDFFCASLARLRGREPCGDALDLFALGVRLLEHAGTADYSRRARQLAAVCLRENLGGAYACALIDFVLRDNL